MPDIPAEASPLANRIGVILEENVEISVPGLEYLSTGLNTLVFIKVKERSGLGPGPAPIRGKTCGGFVGLRRPSNAGGHQSAVGQQCKMRFFEGCDYNRGLSLRCSWVDQASPKCHHKDGQAGSHSNHLSGAKECSFAGPQINRPKMPARV